VLDIYTKDDGLHSHDFWPTSRRNTKEGQLWFGDFNGVNRFYPDRLKNNENLRKYFSHSSNAMAAK
jgi:hypothetical protein